MSEREDLIHHRPPWLSHRSYNFALNTCASTDQKSEGFREFLLAHWFRTDLAIAQLGINNDGLPGEIPGEGEIYKPALLKGTGIEYVEIMGMPGAGKDTMIDRLGKMSLDRLICTKEPYSQMREVGWFEVGEEDVEQKKSAGSLAENLAALLELKRCGYDKGGLVVLNRSMTDNYFFTLSRLLAGALSISDYKKEWMHRVIHSREITFVFMITPEECLKRGEGGKLGRRFLRVLYSQYLRFISEARHTGWKNLVVLDMSGEIEENFGRFLNLFKQAGPVYFP